MTFSLVSSCLALAVAASAVSCDSQTESTAGERVESAQEPVIVTTGPTTTSTPIGLAVRIENGAGIPLKVRAGQTFYINQIDMRAALDTNVDEGVAGLAQSGDFATVPWNGVKLADESALDTPNQDGTWTNRRFYRSARWMDQASTFRFTQVDANGAPTAAPLTVNIGLENNRRDSDAFFVRRMRAIQWIYDCASRTDCSNAHAYQEEALVELRNSLHPESTFAIAPGTTALQVVWSQNSGRTYTIPVEQVAAPALDYGFTIELTPITPPGPDGTYAPGSDVSVQVQLRDGAGNPLHPPGVLPSFNSVMSGNEPSGIQYWRGLFEPFTTYYRRKHMERQLLGQMVGPAQKVQPVRTVADLGAALGEDGTVYVGKPERDGLMAQGQSLPSFNQIFGGLYYPPLWDFPVPAVYTYHIPANAEPGTYLLTQKGRRVYLGQDIPASTTIEIQVGTPQHTSVSLTTGGCQSCHTDNSSLKVLLHGNGNRGACAACHAPLTFELEGPVYVRTHFLHSRSNRFDAQLHRCANCHVTAEGIQRTSKSACLSCHNSYPQSHVDQFGAIDNMYVGTETGAFEQCTAACHTTHPGSGLN
jgi:hypothetical protein